MIRPATAADLMFLEQMLAVAADWFSDTPRSASEIISDPAVAHYIAGLLRGDDVGVVAQSRRSISGPPGGVSSLPTTRGTALSMPAYRSFLWQS
jgi:hypothetical protein